MMKSAQSHADRPPEWTLSALGADTAAPGFGSQGVAQTGIANDCVIDAVENLFPKSLEIIRQANYPAELVSLDELRVDQVTEPLMSELADLLTPETDPASCQKVVNLLLASKQQQGIANVARVHSAVEQKVAVVIASFKEKINRVGNAPPDRQKDQVTELLKALHREKPELRDANLRIQLAQQAIDRTCDLNTRDREIAVADQALMIGELKEWCQSTTRGAVQAFLIEVVTRELISHWADLVECAQGLLHLASESISRLDALERGGRRYVNEEREARRYPACTTILELPGTEADEAIAGTLSRLHKPSRQELAAHLAERWLARLRSDLLERNALVAQTGGDFQVLAAVPVTTAVERYVEILREELAPEIMSIYGRLKQYGIERALFTLLERSLLTSDPGPRATTKFQLNVYRVTVLSLPKVLWPEDQAIEKEIRTELTHQAPSEIVFHQSEFDEIVVHRIGGGWPWQVLPSNRHLLDQAVKAEIADHRIHIVNLLPESPRGAISPAYLNLHQQEHRHDVV